MKKAITIILAVVFVFAFASTASAQITKDQYYARSTLSGNELEYYDAIYDDIVNNGPGVYLEPYDISYDGYLRYYYYLYNDAPETYNRDWIFTAEEDSEIKEKLQQKADEIIGDIITNDMTDYEKVKSVYYWIAENTDYGVSTKAGDRGQTIVGALLYNEATCRGLSSAIQYLLYQIDIPCYTVSGGSHAWNIIQIDGEWYNADITKDQQTIKYGVNDLDWFLWDDSFYDDHEQPDMDENPPLPACTSDKYMVAAEVTTKPTPTPTVEATPEPDMAAEVTGEPTSEAAGGNTGWMTGMVAAIVLIVVLVIRGIRKKDQ